MQECSSSAEASDGRTVFATIPNGQMKMPRMGNFCLSMMGDGAAKVDVARGADVSATSSSTQHSANNVADGSSQSFWASGFDPTSGVDMSFDFGASKVIDMIEISWEHPPLVRLFVHFISRHGFAPLVSLCSGRHLSSKLPTAEYGAAFTRLPATISTSPNIWGGLFSEVRCAFA